jgi:hypothetical protein
MLLVSACVPAEPGEDAPTPAPGEVSAYVITSDYSDSIVARVDLDSGEIHDGLAAFPAGDMVLETEGDDIYLLSRSGEDVIRRYPGGDFSREPDLEVSTGAGSNPHALILCSEQLWVSLYNRSELVALDPASGEVLHTVDLHDFDEGADGSCEPSSMVAAGGSLYVALERFDLHNLRADPAGRILQLRCEDGAVLNGWATGPSPQIQADPRNDGALLVKEGDFYTVDGGVRSLVPATGEFGEVLLSEAELNADLGGVAASSDHLVASSWAFGSTPALSSLHCFNRETAEQTSGVTGLTQNLWHLDSAPSGEAWATLSPSAAEPTAEHGIMIVDPTTCGAVGDGLLSFLLPPTHLVFMESEKSGRR